jgi:hypothetical protein
MDYLGIGAELNAIMEVFFRAKRRTGKTTRLIDQLKDGDTVVCHSERDSRFLRRELTKHNLNVTVLFYGEHMMHEFMRNCMAAYRTPGKLIFSHEWLELYYTKVLQDAAYSIGRLESDLSNQTPNGIKSMHPFMED